MQFGACLKESAAPKLLYRYTDIADSYGKPDSITVDDANAEWSDITYAYLNYSIVFVVSGDKIIDIRMYDLNETGEAKGFPYLIVSSEVNFHTIWEPAINELQLTYIGNQRWLYRKDLDRILEEFNKLLDFSRDKAELDNIFFHVSDIIDNLKEY